MHFFTSVHKFLLLMNNLRTEMFEYLTEKQAYLSSNLNSIIHCWNRKRRHTSDQKSLYKIYFVTWWGWKLFNYFMKTYHFILCPRGKTPMIVFKRDNTNSDTYYRYSIIFSLTLLQQNKALILFCFCLIFFLHILRVF